VPQGSRANPNVRLLSCVAKMGPVTYGCGEMKIFAHRGSSARAPENTLAAIHAALEDHADGIEVDAQLTRDGEVVLVHDYDLLRVAQDPRPVRHCTYLELAELDVGRWFGPKFVGERIPRLTEVIQTVRGHAWLDIELKTWPADMAALELAESVVDIVRSLRAQEFCLLSVSSPEVLAHLCTYAPVLKVGWIVSQGSPELPEGPGCAWVAVEDRALPSLWPRLQRPKLPWWVWTVNDPTRAKEVQALGATGLITDVPAQIRAALA